MEMKHLYAHQIMDFVYLDNGMNIFFGGIKDYKKMAEWLTKWSPAIAAPIIRSKMINGNDKIK